jgi:hypothetical protein
MRSRFCASFAALALVLALLVLHAPPAGARSRSRFTRRRAWCSSPHDRRDPKREYMNTMTIYNHQLNGATKYCCEAIKFHWAYYSQVISVCHSQGGYVDRGIDWYNFKRCCEEQTGMASSDDVDFDDMDMEEEVFGVESPHGWRWREYIGIG